MKTCTKCKETKEEEAFQKIAKRPGVCKSWCKECTKAAHRAYHRNNVEKCRAYRRKWNADHPGFHKAYRLKSQYGLTQEGWDLLFNSQGGACAICKNPDKKLCVDHDHFSGRVRGLLGHQCNWVLGILRDSSLFAHSAGAYLEKHAL